MKCPRFGYDNGAGAGGYFLSLGPVVSCGSAECPNPNPNPNPSPNPNLYPNHSTVPGTVVLGKEVVGPSQTLSLASVR